MYSNKVVIGLKGVIQHFLQQGNFLIMCESLNLKVISCVREMQ